MPSTSTDVAGRQRPLVSDIEVCQKREMGQGESRVVQLLNITFACFMWGLAALLSFLTMCIVYFAKFSSSALGFSVASITFLIGFCPTKDCYMNSNSCKVLCIFVIVFAIIEYTGFVVPLFFHGYTAYLLVTETRDIINSPTEDQKSLDKGPLIAGTVFSILSTLAVSVMAVLWCCVACSPTVLETCLENGTRRRIEEREAQPQREQEQRERDAEEELYKNISTQYPSYSAFPSTSIN